MYDLVIENGTIIDPARNLRTVGNLGIIDGKITAVTREKLEGLIEIDASHNVVSPGFIDIHAHVDNYLYSAQCMALQGVTTTIGGNCGLSPVLPEEFFRKMRETGFPINQGQLVGHSFTLREIVGVNDRYQPATKSQILQMADLTEEALADGALGISFGLEYAPGSSFEEILTLSKIAARYDKLVAIHTRYDSWRGIEAIHEAVKVAELTGAKIQISHMVYMVGMGMMTEALKVVEAARKAGLDIMADSGLYSAFATFAGSAVFDKGCLEKWGVGYDALFISTGKYAGQKCTADIFKYLRNEEPDAVITAFVGREDEVSEALCADFTMVSSDGAVGAPVPGTGHPQDAGTFPRLFRVLVREQGALDLMDALKKCTVYPADRLGLGHKGKIQINADADLVIFNPNTIFDKACYPGLGLPDQPPKGIEYVIVNGQPIVEKGKINKELLPGEPVILDNKSWRI